MALFGLSKIPHYEVTGDNRWCTLHGPSINMLWNQIPNIAVLKNEGDNIIKIYNKCSMLSSIYEAADSMNKKYDSYAHNYVVQLFYKSYDEC